jgi:RNA recognition motif-containing protein
VPSKSDPPQESKVEEDKFNGERTIFVRGFTKNVTEKHLKDIFKRYGSVCNVKLCKRKANVHAIAYNRVNQNHGQNNSQFALITFKELIQALKAIAHMNNGQIDGSKVHVDIYKDRRELFLENRGTLFFFLDFLVLTLSYIERIEHKSRHRTHHYRSRRDDR